MEKKKTLKKKKQKKAGKKSGSREYSNIMLLFTGIFLLMIGYLVFFQVARSRETINNPYNARLDTFEKRVIRGNILAQDGQVLAYTKVSEDGTETRYYPFDCTFAHVLGYSDYGKTGIEETGNFQLLTSNAYFVEKFINELKEQKNIGDQLVTTLDVDLQTAAHDALGDQKGAVIVMEAATGNVRALVSKPDYDPGLVRGEWDRLSTSEDSILLNRAMQGLYPPGSTFKTITLLEYLREHRFREEYAFTCEGKISVGNSSISCYHGTRHGELDLKLAYARSCNSAFADMGRELNVRAFQELSGQLLFDSELPLDFPYSKSSFRLKESDSEALQMMTAIGQGDTLVTPMHMAMITAAIANNGILMIPRFLDRTESHTGATVVERYPVAEYGRLMSAQEAGLLQEYMRAVVEEGTAAPLLSDVYTAAGKTGTAEYSSDKSRSHAWFAGYVSGDKPDLVVCVLVESAGSSSEYAVPVAKRVFDTYYAGE